MLVDLAYDIHVFNYSAHIGFNVTSPMNRPVLKWHVQVIRTCGTQIFLLFSFFSFIIYLWTLNITKIK